MHLDINDLYTEETEVASIQKNDKDKFYVEFAKYGFDFNEIDKETKLPVTLKKILDGDIEYVLRFNNALIKLHRSKLYSIIESIVNLTTDYVEYDELAKTLQPTTLGLLTTELATKHKLCTITSVSAVHKFIH